MSSLVLRHARLAGRVDPANVVVADGRIVAVCDDIDLRDLRPDGAQVVDLAGRFVTPGLTDSHIHPVLALGLTDGIDLSGCTTLDDVRRALAAAADSTDGWLVGWGLDPNCFGELPVDNRPLAAVVGDRPMFLRLFDGHSAVVSDEALRRAGIAGPREFASHAEIVCDAAGQPTGFLLEEAAMAPVQAVLPQRSFVERRERLRRVLASMAAVGLTGGHVMDCDGDSLELYTSLDDADELPLRLRIAPWRRPEDDDRRVAELLDLQRRRGRLWQVAGVKLFMDGTIDNGTAWLAEPDCHGESTRPYWADPQAYTRAVHELAANGVQTATHAIGDAAVGHVLATMATLPAGARRGHRIEHIETLPDNLVAEFARHDVTASMQPTHATDYTRGDHSDNWSRRLGTERASRAWRCGDLLRSGARLSLGSDWPIAPFDPRPIMAAAQLRRPWDRPELPPVGAAQALTAAQALAGYTEAPAQVAGATDLGRVAEGFRADLTVWADDPLRQPADQLPHLPIEMTLVDGRVTYRAEALS
ncbi:MAG TPA: amidohydrolase [Jatrophihabitans sp.]|nr:amidohydrolase [Jatrophihabitans sp.]